ncbi:MAG TPA: chitobiase/beta-hexosaminidase C-terminal domain-containing protein, partial [Prolixibacteraceae bacterium]|nr:chitobiase/beta-hexosaminidase C-terminal domain-containing protein [Prolixibacteraceae bacterium]
MNRSNHFSANIFRVIILIGSFLWVIYPMDCFAQQETPQVSDSLKVVFSHKGGFYSSSFNLQLDVPDQSYSILYTIDGSNPQTSKTAIKGGKSKSVVVKVVGFAASCPH